MFRLRALFLGGLTAGILATLGNALPAQPGGGKGQFKQLQVPLLTVLLPYVGDENFQKELNLSDEQAKKLVAFRQKVWDEVYTTPRQNLNIEDQNKAIEAEFKAVLDAAHLKRASQLAARIVWSDGRFGGGFGGGFGGPGGFVTVIADVDPRTIPAFVPGQYPEIAAALKLDETQKTLAEDRPFRGGGKRGKGGGFGGGPFGSDTIYLTPDQTAAAKVLLGDAPKASFRGQSDTRGQFRGGTPGRLAYLLSPDVQKDLKLTEEQIKAATDLQAKFTGFTRFDPAQSPADAEKADAAQLADANAAIDKLLTADQKKRIEQIGRQRGFGGFVFNEGSELGKLIGVTADQRKAYLAAAEAHAAAAVKAVGSGDAPEKVKAAVEAAGKDRDAAVAKILTADQRAKEKEWRGEPFTGILRGGFGGESILVTMRRASFGRYFGELGTLSLYPGVRAELKLTEEQRQKAIEAITALNEKFPLQEVLTAVRDGEKGEKLVADRSAFIEKHLTEILTKEQQGRLRELMIQQAEATPSGPGGGLGGALGAANTAAAVPGVAEAIKLTAEQKKKLLDGTPAAQVLNDDQKAAIKKMMGKPVDATAMFARPGFGNPQPVLARVIVLAQNPGHWDAVKVAPERVAKLAEAFNAFNLATSTGPTTPEQRTAAAEAVTKAVEAALNPDQRKRLEQFAVQATAANSLVTALLGTPVNPAEAVKTLGITDEQAKTIRAAATEFGELADLLAGIQVGSAAMSKELSELRTKLRDRLDAKIEGALTAGQRAKWKEMVGDPDARFIKQPLFGGRGGGGFGGGGFGPGGGFGGGPGFGPGGP